MNNVPQKQEIGYTAKPTIYYPLPYKPVSRHEVSYNGQKCTYFSSGILPYTANDRIWLEIFTTHAVRTKNPYIELGRVTDELAKIGKRREGRNIAAARKSIYRVYGMGVHIESTYGKAPFEQLKSTQFTIGRAIQLMWDQSGRTDNEHQLYLPGTNAIELSHDFFAFLEIYGVVPLIREHYYQMNAKQQDIYRWLIKKVWDTTKKPVELTRDQIATQFFPNSSNTRRDWKIFKEQLAKVHANYYPDAKVSITRNDTLQIKPGSRLLVKPEDKNAGFFI